MAITCWARRSADSDCRRRPVKSHTTTDRASASIRLSMPKPTSATDEAETPAATAIANSATCHRPPPHARRRARR